MPQAALQAAQYPGRTAKFNLHRLERFVNRKQWFPIAVALALSALAVSLGAQSPARVKLMGVSTPTGTAGTASPFSGSAIVFGSSPLAGAPRQLTAKFTLDSPESGVVPTASLHYGHDFSVGAVSCSGQICSVSVSFSPTLPGSRPDALFLADATGRIGTIPLAGVGEAPYALLQPVISRSGAASNGSTAVLDENGTLYLLDGGTVTAIDSSGKSTQLAISGLASPRGIAIDGAGILYILNGGAEASIVTFDTVQGIQGAKTIPVAAATVDSISVGSAGELYAVSSAAHTLYTVGPDGTVAKMPMQGGSGSDAVSSVVALGGGSGLALGGSALQTVSHTGAQTKVSLASGGSVGVLGSDAAGALYANSSGSLLQLAAPAFSTVIGSLPSALAVGSDGSLAVGAGQGIDRLDRTGTSLYFDPASSSADPQLAMLYNAGNASLVISDISVAGAGFAIVSTAGSTCVAGAVVASGSGCEIGVTLDKAQAAGSGNGSVTVTSNSLNQASARSLVTLVPHLVNSQATLSPTTLTFPNTTVKVASAPLTATLTNGGSDPLNISSIALSGGGSGSYSFSHNCPIQPASLAPGAFCTITAIFTPLVATTPQTATITVADDAGQGPTSNKVSTQPLTLTGVGLAAPAPITTLSAATITFGGTTPALEVIDGTTTPPTSTVTITNSGNATLNIGSITLSYPLATTVFPFTFTTTCGATLAASATCTATVQFAPAEGGGTSFTGTLSIADNALNSPHNVAITATSVANDYTLTTSTPTVTVSSAGGSGTFSLTATPDPGPFPTAVDFTVFGMPGGATYSFSPASINPVTAAAASSLIVVLPTYHNIVLSNLDGPAKLKLTYGPAAACLLAGLLFGARRRRMPRLTRALQIAVLGLLGLAASSLTACGGTPESSGVAPGSYPLSITANSANGGPTSTSVVSGYYPYGPSTHNVLVTLVVQ